jgi:cysteinyl-tRNA synthetase
VNADLLAITQRAGETFTAALADDLNTAEARAAIFDLVRAANAAADAGQLCVGNVDPIVAVLRQFDEIFAVLENTDDAVTRAALEWAEREGRSADAAPELLASFALTDERISELIAERNQARAARDFARADEVRQQLAASGILLEDTPSGVRWRRK